MKKNLFALVALLATTSMNAQVMNVWKGNQVIAKYYAKWADNAVFEQLVPVQGITLNKYYAELTLCTDESKAQTTLIATVAPADASAKQVLWSSSDETVATVSENGKVIALKDGITTITAKASDDSECQASCTVKVVQKRARKITLNKTEVYLTINAFAEQATATLIATVAPVDVYEAGVIWTSTDPTVATVSEEGVVTALAEGEATIIATAKDGSGKEESCDIYVEDGQRPTYVSSTNDGMEALVDAYGVYNAYDETIIDNPERFIIVSLQEAARLHTIKLWNAATSQPELSWKHVKVSGTNDLTGTWNVLKNFEDLSLTVAPYALAGTLNVNGMTSYKYYKLEITGVSDRVVMSDMKFFLYPTDL